MASHELGVLDAHAEPEGPHGGGVVDVTGHLGHHQPSPRIGGRVEVREAPDVVPATALPGDVGQVESVVDAEVEERRQPVLIDGVPQAQLSRDALVEPVQQRQPIAAFGGRSEPEQFDGLHVVEQRLVRRCGRVVELVDHHDVEVVGGQVGQASGVQALDRREHVLVPIGLVPADPLLANRRVPQRVAERGQALVEDLFAVGDEEQPAAGQLGA